MYSDKDDSPDLITLIVENRETVLSISLVLWLIGIYYLVSDIRFAIVSDTVQAVVTSSHKSSYGCDYSDYSLSGSCTGIYNGFQYRRPDGTAGQFGSYDYPVLYPTGTTIPYFVLWGSPDEIRNRSLWGLFHSSFWSLGAALMLLGLYISLSWEEIAAGKSLKSGFLSKIFKSSYGHQFKPKFTFTFTPEGRSSAFMIATFSMFAKLARVDSKITPNEITEVENIMRDALKLDEHAQRVAVQIFRHARQSPQTFQDHALEFKRIFHRDPKMLRFMLTLLHQIASVDGHIGREEEDLLDEASDIFGIPRSQTRTRFTASQNSAVRSDPYYILGLEQNSPIDQVKSAYRRLAKENHPDSLLGRGLPPELMRAATERFTKIQAAYEEICAGKN